jgi:hypothetical protein
MRYDIHGWLGLWLIPCGFPMSWTTQVLGPGFEAFKVVEVAFSKCGVEWSPRGGGSAYVMADSFASNSSEVSCDNNMTDV